MAVGSYDTNREVGSGNNFGVELDVFGKGEKAPGAKSIT
jgi:hypothetical protein